MLWWESWEVATSDMRKQADPDEKPRKLTPPELDARRQSVLMDLKGCDETPADLFLKGPGECPGCR